MDTAYGEKIVNHVFGGQQDQVASQLAGTGQLGGAGSDLVRKLLPILAPIVMSYLAKKFLGGNQAGAGSRTEVGAPADSGQGGGMDLGGVLGGILGGSSVARAALRVRAAWTDDTDRAAWAALAISLAACSGRSRRFAPALVTDDGNSPLSPEQQPPLAVPDSATAPIPPVQQHSGKDKRDVDCGQPSCEPSRQVDVRDRAVAVAEVLGDSGQRAVEAIGGKDQGFARNHDGGNARLPVGAAPDSGVQDVGHAGLGREPGSGVNRLHYPQQ